MTTIVGVGIATLDLVFEVDGYPAEDTEIRALAHRRTRGGNAANTLVVLAQLGYRTRFVGALPAPDRFGAGTIDADLARHGVDVAACPRATGGVAPTSIVLLDRGSGSRTIVHHRDLPELTFQAFDQVDLAGVDWFHFEARNVPETERMLAKAAAACPTTPRSLEVEKPRDGLEQLLPLADVLVLSRAFATTIGHRDAPSLLAALGSELPGRTLICPWGEDGAFALAPDGVEHACPAAPPPRVVDTLGAGDVFNAGVIDGMLRGLSLVDVLRHACRLAGRQCGRRGLELPARVEPSD